MVGVTRFERAAYWSQTSCATKLRYTPILAKFPTDFVTARRSLARVLCTLASTHASRSSSSENLSAYHRGYNFNWQGQKGSNPRHVVLETTALPTELYPYKMIKLYGGKGEIRTRAALANPNGLANRPLQPLEYFPKFKNLAEIVGFEPTHAFTCPVFKTGAFSRSAISPRA